MNRISSRLGGVDVDIGEELESGVGAGAGEWIMRLMEGMFSGG